MRYYAVYDKNNILCAIGIGDFDGVEITEEEYNAILSELHLKQDYAQQVFLEKISLNDVPEIYRNEVETMVKELIAIKELEDSEDTSDVNYDELVNVIREGVNEV